MRNLINKIQNVFRVYREADAITQNNYDRIISSVIAVIAIAIGAYGLYLGFNVWNV